ncbi:MAG: glycosyltransferase family 4 protein [Alphaproteobacteria bacterium]|nr:glycosyltransferase family 4 protein [Alphaproteobacteria bacterium]
MRIAFYAPLKSPRHPVPSGDRRMSRLLMDALALAGHDVELATAYRSWEPSGDGERQHRLQRVGAALAARLVRRYRARPPGERPHLWFTYHVYYKAPDWIGPAVADGLGIPYVAAEASHSPKRAGGAWEPGHRATIEAMRRAAVLFALNRDDLICLPDIVDIEKVAVLPPFLDAAPYAAASRDRDRHRAAVAGRYGIDPALPWLLTVAMMRGGDKFASYELLAAALAECRQTPWQSLIVGDGPAGGAVRDLFCALPQDRLHFAGALAADALPAIYAAGDMFLWPAVGEAFGMAILEAQAAGLPVVAGDTRGVPDIVTGSSAILTPVGDADAFADAVTSLVADPARRRRMSRSARDHVASRHDISRAAEILDRHLRGLVRHAA